MTDRRRRAAAHETGDVDLSVTAQTSPTSAALLRAARVHRMTAGRLLRAAGLFPGQEVLMMMLWDDGPARQGDLIRRMGVDPSTLTKMLQRLEQAGHVRRVPDPADGRAVLVEATESSTHLHATVAGLWADMERRATTGLSEHEQNELTRLLWRVGDNLTALDDSTAACGSDDSTAACGSGDVTEHGTC